MADVGDDGRLRPLGDLVDWHEEVRLARVAVQEEQPQAALPPDGGLDDRADAREDVVVGDDGNGQ
ncbi:MAG: hypothetical protein ACRDNW_10575 [Trebonia sp.]